MQSIVDEEFVARSVAPNVPPSGCSISEVLEYITQQLDAFGKEHLLLGKYQLLGPRHRFSGGKLLVLQKLPVAHFASTELYMILVLLNAGQGVVQFARRVDGSGTLLYAIKFFAHRSNCAEEAEVYRSSPLRHFMPSVLCMECNERGAIQDPLGGVLAPLIVMEKGESLQERARNGRVDLFTAAQVRNNPLYFSDLLRFLPPRIGVSLLCYNMQHLYSNSCIDIEETMPRRVY